MCLGMKDNFEPALSTNKEAISNATMNIMESSILAQDERWRHAQHMQVGREVVDSKISNQLIGFMVYLSIENDTKDLYLFINSLGKWVIPGVAIYDTMQFVQPDVHTICMRLAASMGSFLLAEGEITKRLAFLQVRRQ
ncbi:hypothetical protein Gotur_003368 [Gossypium turneri]